MKVIGITGGVGCGKSTILDLIQNNFNACIIKTDEVGRHVLDPGTDGYKQVIELFGTDLVMEDGYIDRAKLAEIVFHDDICLMQLNDIVHPAVKAKVLEDIADARQLGKCDYYFVESALLFDDHYEVFCDEVWYVCADYDTRKKRLMESRGYTEEKILAIMKQQLPDEIFCAKCDFVLDNSKTLEEALEQLKKRLVVQ